MKTEPEVARLSAPKKFHELKAKKKIIIKIEMCKKKKEGTIRKKEVHRKKIHV